MTTSSGFWTGANSDGTTNCNSTHSQAELQTMYNPPTNTNNGINGEQGRLYNHDGRYYFVTNTNDNPQPLKDWFSVAALRGESGSNVEEMIAGAGYVAHPANFATNQGFIRDEGAVLLIFFITDEPDKSPEPVNAYLQMVRDAKVNCGGDLCILTAGVIEMGCYNSPANTILYDFMNGFGKPPAAIGEITGGGDYSLVLSDALADVIAETCSEIGPPG